MTPGPLPKDPDRRQRRNQPRELRVVPGRVARRDVPPAPAGLLKVIREAWVRFWASDLAQQVEFDTDGPSIERLFGLYDERERSWRAYRKRRYVEGSKGQPVLNPVARMIGPLDKEIRALEDRLGLNPRARYALGIKFSEAQRTLGELNRDLEPEWEDDEDDDEAEAG